MILSAANSWWHGGLWIKQQSITQDIWWIMLKVGDNGSLYSLLCRSQISSSCLLFTKHGWMMYGGQQEAAGSLCVIFSPDSWSIHQPEEGWIKTSVRLKALHVFNRPYIKGTICILAENIHKLNTSINRMWGENLMYCVVEISTDVSMLTS